MKKNVYIVSLFCVFAHNLFTQSADLRIHGSLRKIDIPFEYSNDFIILNIVFNDYLPLKFIFDTGSEHTILAKREITDLLQVNYQRRFTLLGADMSSEVYAYLVRGVSLRLNDKITALNRSILVLEEDYLHFEELAGLEIHGIIGSDIFRRFVVKIDYNRKIITLYEPNSFEAPGGNYDRLPIEISRHKPYVNFNVRLQNDTLLNLKLLLDTGASLALLLHTNTHPDLKLPDQVIPSNLGAGLGGYIQGFMGRVEDLDLGDTELHSIITHFQEIGMNRDSVYAASRNGIIGNKILDRYTIIIDYIRQVAYLEPNGKFSQKFEYDKSGLSLISYGLSLNKFRVFSVLPGSPAAEAGLQKDDDIKTVNGWPASLWDLASLNAKFKKKAGKKITLKVLRNGEKLKFTFYLRDLI
ncbi:MAG TPA: aspartyl protease family protein [Saprospiraceae bacterium]|nr:aspartyl protease family protein [Saprospiraceae bacterium]HMQ84182.1 aspartyl protease family protein [Saprospiraceae bacterium]